MMETDSKWNICEIFQSFGTGKSRAVREMANLIFTIPINISDTDDICMRLPLTRQRFHRVPF